MGDASSRRVEVTVLGDSYPIRTPNTSADERRLQSAAALFAERLEEIGKAT